MRIILTEIRGDQELDSHEFEQPTIKLGRDKARNDVVFSRELWPTVSRLHAEIRLENGHWYLTDKGSSCGTFLNGEPVSTGTEIRSGSLIEFGYTGPKLRVQLVDYAADAPRAPRFSGTFIDDKAASQQAALRARSQPPPESSTAVMQTHAEAADVQKQLPLASSPLPQAAPEPHRPAEAVKSLPVLICESGSPAQVGRRFELKDDRTLMGRDSTANISIDAAAPMVSRRHAEIHRQNNGGFVIIDLNSFNGTLVNDQRINQPTPLHDGDCVQFAVGGPIFRFINPAIAPPKQRSSTGTAVRELAAALPADAGIGLHTIISRSRTERPAPPAGASDVQLLFERTFDGKRDLSVGRDPENDIQLDGLLISKHHARFINSDQGVLIEDVGSTNGIYVNGQRVRGRHLVQSQDVVQIGAFVLRADPATGIAVFDSRSKTRIDAIAITETVARPSGRGSRKLLDEISLAIEPNEFVGVLGPSGAGKSVLLSALIGIRRTTSGRILINNLDLYQHVDSLKQSLGYVPQDDIIHRELTVYRTLYYVARLRLSRDVPADELEQIISEVLDVTGLTDRRDVLVSQLSGGQRKRVSIAVELITKPSVIFLDEPTSGLDPATEEKIMKFFREIAESGRTVILTTHAMENVRLFDRIVLLLRGKLVFYGKPDEALAHVGAESFKDLYDKLEAPITERLVKENGRVSRDQVAEEVAEEWKRRFIGTQQYLNNIQNPLTEVSSIPRQAPPAKGRTTLGDVIRQWTTLSRRYLGVLSRDRFNLLILFAQAPIIGLLTYLVVGSKSQRDFPYFILALVALLFGTSVAAREVIRERAVYNRERMVNLRLLPYVGSKLFVLTVIVSFQCLLLFGTLKLLDVTRLMSLPGTLFGLPKLLVMVLTGMVGIALGLFISAVVKTSEMATSLVPLILIPQILFSGLVGVPVGLARVAGVIMPATWSFDEMKRLSALDVLRGKDENAQASGKNEGRGLYKQIEYENDSNIVDAQRKINNFRADAEKNAAAFDKELDQYQKDLLKGQSATEPPAPKPGPPPEIAKATKIPDDLSSFVDFLHPWGGHLVNLGILFTMLLVLLGATGLALRSQDIG